MPASPYRRLLAAFLALSCALGAALAQTPAPVRLATNVERTYFPPAEALLRKAYKTLGLKVEFLPWPLPRAHVALMGGQLDGVAMRATAYFDASPQVRRVDVPLLELQLYAFGRPPCPQRLTLAELPGLRLSHQRGMAAVEALLPAGGSQAVNTPADALLDVATGNADYALILTTRWFTDAPVPTRAGTLCRVPEPLARTQLFHGVHEAQAARVAPLERALRELQDSGEIRRGWQAYERQLTAANARFLADRGRSLRGEATAPPATPAPAPAPPTQ